MSTSTSTAHVWKWMPTCIKPTSYIWKWPSAYKTTAHEQRWLPMNETRWQQDDYPWTKMRWQQAPITVSLLHHTTPHKNHVVNKSSDLSLVTGNKEVPVHQNELLTAGPASLLCLHSRILDGFHIDWHKSHIAPIELPEEFRPCQIRNREALWGVSTTAFPLIIISHLTVHEYPFSP